ncbi:MAG: trigger factor [Armatimonadetes bacterium]|nr:trigger factor [Armatimonadota bacterium]
MQFTAERKNPCEVALHIKIEEEEVSKAFDKAFHDYATAVQVPGFRKGKAPRPILERYVDAEKVRERATSKLVLPAILDALKKEDLNPYTYPHYEGDLAVNGQPFEFEATIELPPSIILGPHEHFDLERTVYTVTEEEIDELIGSQMSRYTRLIPVTDRSAESGDLAVVELSLTPKDGSEPLESREFIVVGQTFPWLDEQLIGQKEGNKKEFETTLPEDFNVESLRGKSVQCAVQLHSLNQKQLPVLNDEFVAGNLGYSSVQEFREHIRQQLAESYAKLSNSLLRDRLIDQIVKSSTISIPPELKQRAFNNSFRNFKQRLEKEGSSVAKYLEETKLTLDEMQQILENSAIERVNRYLIEQELIEELKIEVTEAEIDAEMQNELSSNRRDPPSRNEIISLLKRDKLYREMLSRASITDVPESSGKSDKKQVELDPLDPEALTSETIGDPAPAI